ncbi:hypothetical protein BD779DRAFT_951008 [Infundibulicybe gibba]|nr:hypothetical protein BD779DRAFT_951008 [Infundibulicybe gibba]
MAASILQALRLLKRVLASSNVVRYLLKYLRISWDTLRRASGVPQKCRPRILPPKHDAHIPQSIPLPDAIAASYLPPGLPDPIIAPSIEASTSDITDAAEINTLAVLKAAERTPMEEIHGQVAVPPAENQGESPNDHLYPIMPTGFRRYERTSKVKPSQPKYTIRPNQTNFSRPGKLPPGWIEYIHFEGQVFFYHKQKRIITDSWLWDTIISDQIARFVEEIEEFIRSQNLKLPEDSDLVLDLVQDMEDEYWCGYYYVDHSTKIPFWLEEFDVSSFIAEVQGDLCPSHIRNYLEAEYWCNWALFYNIYPATALVQDQLESMLRDAQTDVQTSRQSTINHSFGDLKNMMQIVKGARENMTSTHANSWFIGRFMHALWRDRFLNFHGQKVTRHSRKWSVHGDQPGALKHSYLIKILSPILFCAPDVHLNAMEELWVDKLTIKPHWTHFIGKLNEEWVEHITYSTILLNANVAFLAIPSNDNAGSIRSAAQTISYFSTMSSLASVIIGLLLVRQHRTRECGTAHEIRDFLFKRNHRTRGLETLAIMYSLPYALLMVVSFFGAFLTMCFQSTNLTPLVVIAAACLFFASLVVWCIRMAWAEREDRWWNLFNQTWQQLKDSCQNLIPAKPDIDSSDTSTVAAREPSLKMFLSWSRNSRNTSTDLPMTYQDSDPIRAMIEEQA